MKPPCPPFLFILLILSEKARQRAEEQKPLAFFAARGYTFRRNAKTKQEKMTMITTIVAMVSTVLAKVLVTAFAVAITVRFWLISTLHTAKSAAMGREPERTAHAVMRVVSVSPHSAAMGDFTPLSVSDPPRTA